MMTLILQRRLHPLLNYVYHVYNFHYFDYGNKRDIIERKKGFRPRTQKKGSRLFLATKKVANLTSGWIGLAFGFREKTRFRSVDFLPIWNWMQFSF